MKTMKIITALLSLFLFASVASAAAIAPSIDPTIKPATEPASLKEAINKDTADYTQRMYNQFLEKTFHWLDKAENVADKGGDFISEQAPLVCNEIVAWGRLVYGFYVVFGLSLSIVGIVLFRRSILEKSAIWIGGGRNNQYPTWRLVRLCVGIVTGVIGICFVFVKIHTFLLSCVAPRLFILQQIRDLLQGVSGS